LKRAGESPSTSRLEFFMWLCREGMVIWYFMWRPEYRDRMLVLAENMCKLFYQALGSILVG
jgi:hypothetical protein